MVDFALAAKDGGRDRVAQRAILRRCPRQRPAACRFVESLIQLGLTAQHKADETNRFGPRKKACQWRYGRIGVQGCQPQGPREALLA